VNTFKPAEEILTNQMKNEEDIEKEQGRKWGTSSR
jgi:hypothetical protein